MSKNNQCKSIRKYSRKELNVLVDRHNILVKKNYRIYYKYGPDIVDYANDEQELVSPYYEIPGHQCISGHAEIIGLEWA